jgi:hypothetical protein
LNEIRQHSQLVTQAAKKLENSIVQHLQKENQAVAQTSKTKIKRNFGEVLTEKEVRDRLFQEETNRQNKKKLKLLFK